MIFGEKRKMKMTDHVVLTSSQTNDNKGEPKRIPWWETIGAAPPASPTGDLAWAAGEAADFEDEAPAASEEDEDCLEAEEAAAVDVPAPEDVVAVPA